MAYPSSTTARTSERSGLFASPPDVLTRPDGARIGVVCSMAEEKWTSMDFVADMLLDSLSREVPESVEMRRIRPPMNRRFTFHPRLRTQKIPFNADRLLNRFWDYPRYLQKLRDGFDLFHIVDHSYAQLANVLPAGQCIVTCHDLDAFRSLLAPDPARHRAIHRAMARRQLAGLQRAAYVACDSAVVKREILHYGLLPDERLLVIPLGVHPTCSPMPSIRADAAAAALLGPVQAEAPEILHVSSTVPRKRIDLLLEIFARIRARYPKAKLVRAGGRFTGPQNALMQRLGLEGSICVLPFLDRETLAAVYRRSALVLHPSEAEGFGLPVLEALACGAVVAASDLPVFQEVGGDSVTYLPVGDIGRWADSVSQLLEQRTMQPELWEGRRRRGIRHAGAFTWPAYAAQTAALYRRLLAQTAGS